MSSQAYSLAAQVGRALTTEPSLERMLAGCTQAIVDNLGAAFARIWTLRANSSTLELLASSGLYTHLDGEHSRVPVGQFKIGKIAEDREPVLTNEVASDPRISNQAWAKKEGMVAFAGYPLVLEERLVGVLALFSRTRLTPDTIETLASIADEIAIGIGRKEAEKKLLAANRALETSRSCHEIIVRAQDESELLQEVCARIVGSGGYRLAWVGFVEHDPAKTVRPVAHAGFDDDYLQTVRISWGDDAHGQGPTGNAIRSKQPVACRNILTDPAFMPWREAAKARGYASSLAIPLLENDYAFGAINFYAQAPDAFAREEQTLLTELSADLSHAIIALRDRQRLEKTMTALAESEERFRAIFNTAKDGMLVANAGTRKFILCNRMICDMLGYEAEEILQLHVEQIHPAEALPRVILEFKQQMTGELTTSKGLPVLRKDGSIFFADITASSLKIAGQDCAVGIFRDISEQKLLEERLRQSQKMEAIGTLAGGIAHDFNNILSPIIGYTELTMDLLPGGGEGQQNLQEVLVAAGRARDLVRQILAFSRKSEVVSAPTMLQPLIKEIVKLLRATLPSTIEIISDIDSDCGAALVDPVQFHQILMNLSTNAFRAMHDGGGQLRIGLEECDWSGGPLVPGELLQAGRYARVTVTDTGCGMNQEILQRIFEPYFTTREKGEGTGMGLSVVHGIAHSHRGAIKVESTVGHGSIFAVYLPAAKSREGLDALRESRDASSLPQGTESIMAVDDEAGVITILHRMLSRLGYRVATFASSREALAAFRQAPDQFDLIITDLNMPGMTGPELTRAVRHLRPDMPVILSSGYANLSKDEAQHFAAVIDKPFKREQLAQTVRQVLDRLQLAGRANQ